MDPNLSEAIERNDMLAFKRLVHMDPTVLDQKSDVSMSTPLHLATGLGHAELVEEIVKLRPDLVAQENDEGETPIHDACRQGNSKVLQLLLENYPMAASQVNHKNQSAFLLASRDGHVGAVRIMLQQTWLMEQEENALDLTPLHAALLGGHKDIVKETLQVRPNFAQKVDKNGFSVLHLVSVKGNIEITKLLLSIDPDLALQYNNSGHTPVHLAVINGHKTILETFYSSSPDSFLCPTKKEETVFHLAVRSRKSDVFAYLTELPEISELVQKQDQYGNTILHLAISTENYQLVESVVSTTVDVNCKNSKSQTALEILEQARTNTEEVEQIKEMLVGAVNIQLQGLGNCKDEVVDDEHRKLLLRAQNKSKSSFVRSWSNEASKFGVKSQSDPELRKSRLISASTVEINRQNKKETELELVKSSKTESSNSKIRATHKRLSELRRKELQEVFMSRSIDKEEQMQSEALLNARNTITLVAILIATVTFAAGINPPGGVFQDGPLKGKSTVGRTTAFKIFAVCNHIALFTSLSIVVVSISIIPFRRKQLMRILVITHKVTWVAASFMATAYVAGAWVVMSRDRGTGWLMATSIAIAAGLFGVTFFYLGVLATKHWLRKRKWRQENNINNVKDTEGNNQANNLVTETKGVPQFGDWEFLSIDSDRESGRHVGYHTIEPPCCCFG